MEAFNVILVLQIAASCILQWVASAPCEPPNSTGYGVVIDAGSSGSRVRVYSVQELTGIGADSGGLPRLEEIGNKKFKPPLADLASSPREVDHYLGLLIARAKELVPEEAWAATPIYLMSTAGLRLVDLEQSTKLFQEIRRVFSNKTACPFLFRRADQARILSGEEEGVYTWLTVNYLREYFGKKRPYNETHGILEMGGASTQIAFIPATPILANKFYVTVARETYPLYAHSYLYYGALKMDIRIKNWLAKQSPGSTLLDDPCMLPGDIKNQTVPSRGGTYLQFVGTGNSSSCEAILESFQRQTPQDMCFPKPCAIGDIYQPVLPDHMTFTAVSAYVYAPSALGALDEQKRLSPRKLRETALLYIKKNLTEAVNQIGESRRQYASSYAMMGLYLPMLLQRSYGFHSDSTQVIATNDVDGKGISWTLGALLYELETGSMAAEQPEPDESTVTCGGSSVTSHNLGIQIHVLLTICVSLQKVLL